MPPKKGRNGDGVKKEERRERNKSKEKFSTGLTGNRWEVQSPSTGKRSHLLSSLEWSSTKMLQVRPVFDFLLNQVLNFLYFSIFSSGVKPFRGKMGTDLNQPARSIHTRHSGRVMPVFGVYEDPLQDPFHFSLFPASS